jgi:signal transduction histidine kinase
MSLGDPETLLSELTHHLDKAEAQLPQVARSEEDSQLRTTLKEMRGTLERLEAAELDVINLLWQRQEERQTVEDLSTLTSDGYLVTDSAGLIIEASSAALSMLNIPARYAERKPLAIYIAMGDRQLFRAALSSLKQGLEMGDWTLRLMPRGADQPRLVHAAARVSRREYGAFKCVRWLLRDVTAQGLRDQELLETRRELTFLREKADLHRQLAEQQTRLSLAMEAAEMGHWEWDLDTGAAVWDAVHNRIVGLPPKQTEGSFDEFLLHVHEDDRPQLNALVRKAGTQRPRRRSARRDGNPPDEHNGDGASKGAFEVEFRTLHPGGAIRWAMARGRAYHERDGRQRLLGVIRDITAAREAQAALVRANQQLEERVRHRTRVLLNAQRQLQSLAAELPRAEERERRRIAVGLHDRISQPLAMARMTLGQLRAAAAKHASLNGGAGNSLAGPLSDLESLLAKAIEESRTLTFELSPPILHELGLKAALEWLAETMQRRHGLRVQLRISAEVDDVAAAADLRGLLFQAARELLTNVFKHAHATQATLCARRGSGGYVRLVVADNGRGFDSFGASAPATSNGKQGLRGFGLFHLKTRVEQIGGRLRLRSRLGGGGTVVRLLVPVVYSQPIVADEDESTSLPRRLDTVQPSTDLTTENHEHHNRTHRRRPPDRSSGTAQPSRHSPGPAGGGRGGRRTGGDRDGQAA